MPSGRPHSFQAVAVAAAALLGAVAVLHPTALYAAAPQARGTSVLPATRFLAPRMPHFFPASRQNAVFAGPAAATAATTFAPGRLAAVALHAAAVGSAVYAAAHWHRATRSGTAGLRPLHSTTGGMATEAPPAAAADASVPPPTAAAEPAKKRGTPPRPKVEINNAAYFDIRVGRIVEVGIHPSADGLYLEKIDVGEAEPRQIISGLVQHVPIEQMQGALVLVMCNLKPAKLRDLMSYGMVLCASQTQGEVRTVRLVSIPEGAKPGDRVTFPGLVGAPVDEMPKKRAEKLLPDFRTNAEGVCCWQDVPLTLEAGVVKSDLLNAHLG